MQFWSGTAFMDTTDALTVAPLLDEAGYHGMVCSDHMIYPRELVVALPGFADRQAAVGTGDRLAGLLGLDRRDGGAHRSGCASPTPCTWHPRVRCSRWPSRWRRPR